MNQSDHELIVKHDKAIFGDGNGDIGMKAKVDEIYDLILAFRGGGLILKTIGLLVIFFGAVAYSFTHIADFIKQFFSSK